MKLKLKINLAIALSFISIYCLKYKNLNLIVNLCDSFFLVGIVYLCIALICHVRNVGFFKSASYIKYRHEKNKLKEEKMKKNDTSPLPNEFLDHTTYICNKYSNTWDNKTYYLISIPAILLSLICLAIS